MGTKKIILLLFLAFYFSCGFYQAKIFPSDQKDAVATNSKYGHAAEVHVGGGRGSAGEVNGDGSRSPSNPGSSNFIPIYAANAHHDRHRGAASSHKNHNGYLDLFATMFFAYLCT
ncbi:uncharacterized protein LOC129886609 [Solanum dulcamara]|uniref:uncharacterized protein LOC129886609 n=1 Tax=Solanum dulcamara TaxID=45834 RepID=UPI002485D69D|nr:uncharacterized protein LOC129886609 [Solanum dulcamara]